MYLTEGVARVSGRAHLDGLASRLPHPPRRITPVPAGRQSWGILPGNCPIRPGWPDPAPGRNRGTRRRPGVTRHPRRSRGRARYQGRRRPEPLIKRLVRVRGDGDQGSVAEVGPRLRGCGQRDTYATQALRPAVGVPGEVVDGLTGLEVRHELHRIGVMRAVRIRA